MSDNTKTGWERENRIHFDEIAVNYDKARWDYPAELFADIFEYLGVGHKTALEIGAGTGKATAPFINAGYDVTAVEMGVNMSAFIREKFKERANLNVITATFEDAALPDDTYDLIYAASAFHWVDAKIGCPKVLCLLKNGGVFALLRYNDYTADGEPLYEEIQAVFDKYYRNFYETSMRVVRHSNQDLTEPSGILNGFGFEDMRAYGFADVLLKFYDTTLTYSADDYVALMDTMSPNRKLPEEYRTAMYTGIKEAIIRHGGRYCQNGVFTLYMGRKP